MLGSAGTTNRLRDRSSVGMLGAAVRTWLPEQLSAHMCCYWPIWGCFSRILPFYPYEMIRRWSLTPHTYEKTSNLVICISRVVIVRIQVVLFIILVIFIVVIIVPVVITQVNVVIGWRATYRLVLDAIFFNRTRDDDTLLLCVCTWTQHLLAEINSCYIRDILKLVVNFNSF